MEIWGGNRAFQNSFEAPGLDIYVDSRPCKDSEAGGDIYYLTSCASGRISRFLLADVSGHGAAAAGLAMSLRNLMRENVNRINQEKFVVAMNREFARLSENSSFATAVVATFFEPTRMLDVSVAGHPYPIYYWAEKKKWFHLNPAKSDANFENMPWGVVDGTTYPGRRIKTATNDMFLLYSDAFIESLTDNRNERMLGVKGVTGLLNTSVGLAPAEVVPFLKDSIGSMATGNLLEDDASLILGHFTETKVRLKDNLMAPIRLFGEVCDRTSLAE